MLIKQVSIYLENEKGSLRALMQLLGENGVNLLALSIADTSGFGIVRCIVKSADVERTQALLRENGYVAKVSSVVCVRMPHRPLGFAGVLTSLEAKELSVEYAYSFCRSTLDDAVMIVRPSDLEKGVAVLRENGVSMITQDEVDRF